MINWIRELFGKYRRNYECLVEIRDIKISDEFKKSPPSVRKLLQKYDYYKKNGKLQSKIILNKNFVLVDGYTSYLVAKMYGIDKVSVYFE